MSRSRVAFVTLPADLADRVERVRGVRAVGAALPPLSAVLREAIDRGIADLEIQPSTEPGAQAPAA